MGVKPENSRNLGRGAATAIDGATEAGCASLATGHLERGSEISP